MAFLVLLLGNDFICKLLSSDGLSGNFMSKNGWFCLFLVGGGEIATTVTKSFTRNKAKIYMKAKGKILDKLEEYFLCC